MFDKDDKYSYCDCQEVKMKPTRQKPIAVRTRASRNDGNPPPAARIPIQQRGIERLERILGIATTLIAARGSDTLRMGEIAELAGISIGSLYQYFPDKAAIIGALAERYNAQGRACVQAILTEVTQEHQLESALHRIVDDFYAMYLEEPAMRDIWGATQADKTLQEIEMADGEAHGNMLLAVLVHLRPRHERAELWTLAMLTMQLIATAVRLAIALERAQGDAIIAAFKRMLPTNALDSLGPQKTKKRLK
jgi:AcrR family transcriptional regulator